MEVKDVRNLQKELSDAVSNMVISFEAETGCVVDAFVIRRTPREPWEAIVDVIVEI